MVKKLVPETIELPYHNGLTLRAQIVPHVPRPELTANQEYMIEALLSEFYVALVRDAIIFAGLPLRFDAQDLLEHAIANKWRLSDEGKAMARRIGLIDFGVKPHVERDTINPTHRNILECLERATKPLQAKQIAREVGISDDSYVRKHAIPALRQHWDIKNIKGQGYKLIKPINKG